MSRITVPITLDGEEVSLQPTLSAAQAISRMHGGFVEAIKAVGRLDFDTISQVIGLGLGLEGREAKELPERVYRAGATDLAGPVIKYLTILSNGGRPPVVREGEDDDLGAAR